MSPATKLAPHWKRLAAYLIDTSGILVVGVILGRVYCRVTSQPYSGLVILSWGLVFFFAQWFLIARHEQSLGKMLLKTKIVLADGTHARMLHGVVLRAWPLFALQMPLLVFRPIKPLTDLLFIVDALFIFLWSRRCLHDRIAGTYVVDV